MQDTKLVAHLVRKSDGSRLPLFSTNPYLCGDELDCAETGTGSSSAVLAFFESTLEFVEGDRIKKVVLTAYVDSSIFQGCCGHPLTEGAQWFECTCGQARNPHYTPRAIQIEIADSQMAEGHGPEGQRGADDDLQSDHVNRWIMEDGARAGYPTWCVVDSWVSIKDPSTLTSRINYDCLRRWMHRNEGAPCGTIAFGIATKVRKMPSWPRSWANFSLSYLYSHWVAWANLYFLGPNFKHLSRS